MKSKGHRADSMDLLIPQSAVDASTLHPAHTAACLMLLLICYVCVSYYCVSAMCVSHTTAYLLCVSYYCISAICVSYECLWAGVYVWAEGARYEGEYKEHKKHGRGLQTWPTGGRYAGGMRLYEGHFVYHPHTLIPPSSRPRRQPLRLY